jgi:MFS family permease
MGNAPSWRGNAMAAAAATTDLEVSGTDPATDQVGIDPTNEVFRDITRGGLAGLIVGVLLAGVGGRLVMRLAALMVPESVGGVTENGNVIGVITVGGTLGLVLAIGLLFGAVAGSLWVTISPWLPASPMTRAVLAIPIAIGLGTLGLVDDRNPDFAILGRDPLVIGSLVLLVALFGPALVLAERWLDGRLPHGRPGAAGVVTGYVLVTAIGTLLTVFLVVPMFLGSDLLVAGLALVVVGVSTLAAWWFRIERQKSPPGWLGLIARAGLLVATVAGLAVATREVAGAVGIG